MEAVRRAAEEEEERRANLRSDSAVCRRIVLAFLDFLSSVQPAPGVDLEGLDVARDCLEEVFKLRASSSDETIHPGMLFELFSTLDDGGKCKGGLGPAPSAGEGTSCTTSLCRKVGDHADGEASIAEARVGVPCGLGRDAKEELFEKFCSALDKVNFFNLSSNAVPDPDLVAKSIKFFDDAVMEVENSGQAINLSNISEMLKLRGNQSVQSKSYSEAIELYTCAIALSERNPVYYCNRAAAFTQTHRYSEAIQDCLKSIEIDPSYSKAYSRLGIAYFSQGNYSDALNEGFLKALQLDPNNDSVKENIQVTQQKLMEQQQAAEASQNTGSNHARSNHARPSSTQPAGSTSESINFGPFSFSASFPPEYTEFPGSAMPADHNGSSTFFPFNFSAAPDPPPTASEFPDMSRTSTQSAGPNTSTQFAVPELANIFRTVTEAAGPAASGAPPSTGFAEVLRNMAASATAPGQQTHARRPDGTSEGASGNPEATEQLSELFRSVMGALSSQLGSQQQQHNMHRGNDGA